MTALLLQPISVRKSKYITDTSATITIGVQQRESFSCTLFNIFLETLLEKLSSVPHHISEKAASALADDVILMSKTAGGLQLLLDNCTEWSSECQMAWNTARESPKCSSRLVFIRLLHSSYPENHCEMWNRLYTLAFH